MGDHQHRARIFLEVVFQPFDRLSIKVVGRFIEQQDAGLLDQQPGQRDPALFTARQVAHRPVARRAAQRFHRDFKLVVERPAIDRVDLFLQRAHLVAQRIEISIGLAHQGRYLVEPVNQIGSCARAVLDVFQHGLGAVELGFLRQIADRDVLTRPGLAGIICVDPGHDLHQGRFADAVRPDDANLGALIELQADIAQHRLGRAGEGLGHAFHDVSVLGGHRVPLGIDWTGKKLARSSRAARPRQARRRLPAEGCVRRTSVRPPAYRASSAAGPSS